MPLRLPGQYFDPERGEHYNLLRDYQPTTGRYLQTDPIGLAGGINPYGYAYGNPLSYIDPTGEVPLVAAAWAYGRCILECEAVDAAMQVVMNDACIESSSCGKECLNPLNWIPGAKAAKTAKKVSWVSKKDFFDGTKYIDKVLSQMKQGDFHAFPESVKGFQDMGKLSKITGNDSITRDMLSIPGGYRGKEGVFEFIKESDGRINHRFFRAYSR